MIDLLLGFFTPWLIYAGILALHFLLPARSVEGYVRDERSGELLRYRLNGPLVLVVSLGAWLGAGYSGIMPWDWLWTHRWSGAALVFVAGWSLSRGANMQKYTFKRDPEEVFLGRMAPGTFSRWSHHFLTDECSAAASGVRSRHVNYLGEILMACGLALALGWPLMIGPWLYPLYYVALLFPRERDDDRRCAEKYGHLWEQYREKVPWRIVPRTAWEAR